MGILDRMEWGFSLNAVLFSSFSPFHYWPCLNLSDVMALALLCSTKIMVWQRESLYQQMCVCVSECVSLWWWSYWTGHLPQILDQNLRPFWTKWHWFWQELCLIKFFSNFNHSSFVPHLLRILIFPFISRKSDKEKWRANTYLSSINGGWERKSCFNQTRAISWC